MSLGLQYLQALLRSNSTNTLRDVRDDFFKRDELTAFRFVKKHTGRYGVLPDSDTLLEHGHRLARANEPPEYYVAKLRERYLYTLIRSRAPELSTAMTNKNVGEAISIIKELASQGSHVLEPESFSTMHNEALALLAEYEQIKASGIPDIGISFGWPTLDAMTMGLQEGDLVVLAGRPNVGKSYIMLAIAFAVWLSRKRIGILSMEMTKKQIGRRFLAFCTRANPNLMRQGQLSVWGESALRESVRNFRRMPPVWIHSADMKNKTTALVEKLIAEHDPEVIFIDAAYRLVPAESRSNMVGHERNAQVVHELKQLALTYKRPIVAVNQYNRSVKQRSTQQADLGSAVGTDAWEQDSSIFIGIRFGPAPFEESSRILDLTKNREGPTGAIRTSFALDPVDFSELRDTEHLQVETDSEWSE